MHLFTILHNVFFYPWIRLAHVDGFLACWINVVVCIIIYLFIYIKCMHYYTTCISYDKMAKWPKFTLQALKITLINLCFCIIFSKKKKKKLIHNSLCKMHFYYDTCATVNIYKHCICAFHFFHFVYFCIFREWKKWVNYGHGVYWNRV